MPRPPRRDLSADGLKYVIACLADCERGDRTRVMKQLAKQLNISLTTCYRWVKRHGLTDGPPRERAPREPRYRDWTKTIIELAYKAPAGRAPIALEDARNQAVLDGLIPPEAADVPISTFHRIAREAGYRQTQRRGHRLAAEHPMEAVLFDASTSEYFSVVRPLGEGDYLLRLVRNLHPIYKNKPLGKSRLRLLVYGLWDMCTGYQISRYTVARGENGVDASRFLCWAFGPKVDQRVPFEGVPEYLWADQGPLVKLAASVELLARLDITLEKGPPYAKERMGGVERTHRTRWNFERTFFMQTGEDRPVFEISLTDLNACLATYLCSRVNNRPSRLNPKIDKTTAWSRGVNAMGGVRKLPENALSQLASERRCWVDRLGGIRVDGEYYEVEGIHSCEVYLRRSLTDGRMAAEHIETGEIHAVKPYQLQYHGTFRGIPDTPADAARKRGAQLQAKSFLFPPLEEAPTVIPMPARKIESRPLEDRLDTTRYPSIEAALQDLLAISGLPIDADLLDQCRSIIEEAGRSRDYVRDLALELRGAVEQQRRGQR